MLRITNFRVPVDDDTPLAILAARRLRLPAGNVGAVIIIRQAIDARRKTNISFVYSLDVELKVADGQVLARLNGDKDIVLKQEELPKQVVSGTKSLEFQPVIVGAGPAGLMAALVLSERGYRPLVLERGRDVDSRSRDVTNFWQTGRFDADSNVQFGEGGAGTFSDGKLTTRVNDPRMREVLDIFISAGAPPEIGYLHKPHVGTDKLRAVVKNLRQRIIAAGGQVEFGAQVTDISVDDGRLTGLTVNGNRHIPCEIALFAIGHSARDTFLMLHQRKVAMAAKAFAIGVRIEHPQDLIDRVQYGKLGGGSKLGAADYALVYHDKNSGRSAFSFCMCPGGLVVAAASELGGVVTNGMSFHNRDSGRANSALAVNVTSGDYDGVLGGIEFQRRYEQLAFTCGGGDYRAPVQTVGDFINGKSGSRNFLTEPSYQPGVTPADLRLCLPDFVVETLAKAIPIFGQQIKGFDHDGAVLTGVETRTSSPVRILRGPEYQSINIVGLYPMGEGAGYAGGIMSAALDGVNAALSVVVEYSPF